MERPGTNDTALDRLGEMLERVLLNQSPRPRRDSFKAPEFTGQGDVAYFTRQFLDVAEANEWNPAATLLHLRDSLKGNAQDCGNAETVEGVLQALQARFGLSVREARNQLTALRKAPKATLQEHAAEVTRLSNVAYADLPVEHRHRLTLDIFQSSLGNAYLQRHLLAVNTPTLEEAVRAGNEFLQIKPTSFPNPHVHMIEDEEQEFTNIKEVRTTPLDELKRMMEKLTGEIEILKKAQKESVQFQTKPANPSTQINRNPGFTNSEHLSKSVMCWTCGQPGHLKRQCRNNAWNQIGQRMTGNYTGPQQ